MVLWTIWLRQACRRAQLGASPTSVSQLSRLHVASSASSFLHCSTFAMLNSNLSLFGIAPYKRNVAAAERSMEVLTAAAVTLKAPNSVTS